MVISNTEYMAKEELSDDSKDELYVPVKSKRTVKTKRMEFDGWGSKPLIEFLKAIGKDTGKQRTPLDLTTIVNEYVNKNNLINPVKKKRVLCDDWLRYLFGKKWVPRIKISVLLEQHLAENRDDSECEDSQSSEENKENGLTASRKRKASSLGEKVTHNSRKVPETPKSCFASIIRKNINLVYLSRSLIQELLKDPETFESKVVGSYVRTKSDPNDYSQKNSHQLLQVTGVRKAPGCGDLGANFPLQVSNLVKEIPISMLSDENFKEEECVDLHNRMLAGSVNRPTVMELQQKAQILHEVIKKHCLVKELALLKNLIDHANEKGRRRELHEFVERKQLLEKPSEQERLLREVPTVIAEELESEDTVQEDIVEDVKKDNVCLPGLTIGGTSADVPFDNEAGQNLSSDKFCSTNIAATEDVDGEGDRTYSNGTACVQADEDKSDTPAAQQQKHVSDAMNSKDMFTEPHVTETIHQLVHIKVEDKMPETISVRNEDKHKPAGTEEKCTEPQGVGFTIEGNHELVNSEEPNGSAEIAKKLTKPPVVIELSDDDDDDHKSVDSHNQTQICDNPEIEVWYYTDPQRITQGPFAMSSLRRWRHYFWPNFRVWKLDQSPVLLDDVIRQMFPT